MKKGVFFVILGFSIQAFGLKYNYQPLMVMDYDDVRSQVQIYIKRSRAQGAFDSEEQRGRRGELEKGLKFLLMRPDSDHIRDSLMVMFQTEISKHEPFLPFLRLVLEESLKIAGSGKKTPCPKESLSFFYIGKWSSLSQDMAF